MKIKDKSNCRVAGWGGTISQGKTVNELNAVDVPVVNLKVCREQWAQIKFNLPANVICAGGYGTDKGFCQVRLLSVHYKKRGATGFLSCGIE